MRQKKKESLYISLYYIKYVINQLRSGQIRQIIKELKGNQVKSNCYGNKLKKISNYFYVDILNSKDFITKSNIGLVIK